MKVRYADSMLCCPWEDEMPKGHSGHRDYSLRYGKNSKMNRESETSLSRKSGHEQGLIERKAL